MPLLLTSLFQFTCSSEYSLSARNALAVTLNVFRGEELPDGALLILLAVVDVLHQR